MRNSTIFSIFYFLFIVIVVGSYVIVAQGPITGTWTSNTRNEKSGNKINISFERRVGTGDGRHQVGESFDYSDLEGLSASQTQNGKVSFRLVREAGTIQCEGTFVNGSGSGTFTFTQIGRAHGLTP